MKVIRWSWIPKWLIIVYLVSSCVYQEKQEIVRQQPKPPITKAVLIASESGIRRMKFGRGAILAKDEIWVLGDDGRGKERGLYYSKDGGTTWQKKLFTHPTIDSPSDIAFTPNKIWLVDKRGYMYYSINNDNKWIKITTPNKYKFEYMKFYQQVGYAIVKKTTQDLNTYAVKPGIQILRTIDAGKNWQICYEDQITLGVLDFACWQENIVVLILDDNSIDDNFILWTADQGKHWKRLFKTDPKFIEEVAFNKEGKLWAVAGEQGIYYSMDKGQSWQHFEALSGVIKNKRWLAIAFNKKDYGVCSASDGTMLLTKNGGQTWEELKTTIVPEDSGESMKVMIGEKFILLDKSGDVYRIALPE